MGKEESRKRRNVNKWRESKQEGVLEIPTMASSIVQVLIRISV